MSLSKVSQIPVVEIYDESVNASSNIHSTAQPKRLLKIEMFFAKHRNKLIFIHLFTALAFIILVMIPLFLPYAPENATPLNNFTEFSRYLMWGLWFPLTLASVVFSGRSWCGLFCPMGAATEWANNHGLRREIPAWLRWEGTPIASFILVTILGQTVGVRDHAIAIAEVFGGTMLLAIIIGFIYGKKKRAWCRHMCPIGLLLGVFSRLGKINFRPQNLFKPQTKYTERGVCPIMIDLTSKNESRHCIECFRCVDPRYHSTLSVEVRSVGVEVEHIRQHNPNISEVMFFFLGTGIALGGFLWLTLPIYQEFKHWVGGWLIDLEQYWIGDSGPWWLMSVHPEQREVFNWLDFGTIVIFMTGVMVIFTMILAFTSWVSAILAGYSGGDRTVKERFIELSYQYMPVALISLILGLGAELFELLSFTGLSSQHIGYIKIALFSVSLLWSLRLGWMILAGQGIKKTNRIIPLIPGLLGSLAVGVAWGLALF